MRFSCLIFLAVISLFLAGCFCGPIPFQKSKTGTAYKGNYKGDLPDEFDFTSGDMRNAITGTWSDADGGNTLTIAPAQDGGVNYSASSGCGPVTAELDVTGNMVYLNEESESVSGRFGINSPFDASLIDAWLSFDSETRHCSFSYSPAVDGSDEMLEGSCYPLDSEYVWSADIVLTKS
jgi:hypothetical protein